MSNTLAVALVVGVAGLTACGGGNSSTPAANITNGLMGGAKQGTALNMPTASSVMVTTLAGTANNYGSADGTGTAATFSWLYGITTDGTSLFAVDERNNTIRMIVPAGSY